MVKRWWENGEKSWRGWGRWRTVKWLLKDGEKVKIMIVKEGRKELNDDKKMIRKWWIDSADEDDGGWGKIFKR